jgi:hypothetical protein
MMSLVDAIGGPRADRELQLETSLETRIMCIVDVLYQDHCMERKGNMPPVRNHEVILTPQACSSTLWLSPSFSLTVLTLHIKTGNLASRNLHERSCKQHAAYSTPCLRTRRSAIRGGTLLLQHCRDGDVLYAMGAVAKPSAHYNDCCHKVFNICCANPKTLSIEKCISSSKLNPVVSAYLPTPFDSSV